MIGYNRVAACQGPIVLRDGRPAQAFLVEFARIGMDIGLEEQMANQHEIHDSPSAWVAEHIQRYVELDGENGHEWNGTTTLLLTTLGRKSGQWHRTALIYAQDGDRYILVASRGGHPHHPNWYLNLVAHPEVEVQVNADKFTAHAATASPEEKARLWPLMTSIWPAYDDYQAKTDRNIPVVILTPMR